jgi:hypothetical protein
MVAAEHKRGMIPAVTADFVRLATDMGERPTADSELGRELATDIGEFVEVAFKLATLALVVADEHAAGVEWALFKDRNAFVALTCARGALEQASRAVWLLDPALTAESRAERAVALLLQDHEDEMKAWGSDARPESKAKHAEVRDLIDQRKKERDDAGLTSVSVPSHTGLAKDMIGRETEYRVYAAAAHGMSWALDRLGFRLDDKGVPTPQLTEQVADAIATDTLQFLARPMRRYAKMSGWAGGDRYPALGAVFDSLRNTADDRP